jgi:hypothetical protein
MNKYNNLPQIWLDEGVILSVNAFVLPEYVALVPCCNQIQSDTVDSDKLLEASLDPQT